MYSQIASSVDYYLGRITTLYIFKHGLEPYWKQPVLEPESCANIGTKTSSIDIFETDTGTGIDIFKHLFSRVFFWVSVRNSIGKKWRKCPSIQFSKIVVVVIIILTKYNLFVDQIWFCGVTGYNYLLLFFNQVTWWVNLFSIKYIY